MTPNRMFPLGAVAMLVLSGCLGPTTVRLEPITPPPGISARVSAEVETSALALNGGTLVVTLLKAGTTDRISNAKLSLVGPTLGAAINRLGNDVSFSPLIPGSYELRVSAPGYKTQVEGNITLEANQELTRTIALEPEGGTVSGRVVVGGTPIWGARVLLGEAWTFTDQEGRFTLTGVGAGPGTLKVRKGGYQNLDRSVTVSGATSAGDLSLTAKATARTVAIANPTQTWGDSTIDAQLIGLKSAVNGASDLNWTLSPGNADVRLVASPKATLNAEEYQRFVAGGGTLIVTGEWAGFGDYDPEAANALTRPFGLALRPDLVRVAGQTSNREWVAASVASSLPVSSNVDGLMLRTGSSVMTNPLATILATTGTNGYRVQAFSTGQQTLAAAMPHGDGLVIVVGDTSAWVGSSLEVGNREFMLNLFRW